MKSLGSSLQEYATEAGRLLLENEQRLRERAGRRGVHKLVSDDFGPEFSAMLPDDFTFADYAALDPVTVDSAKRRLTLCSKCPSHGGACASEYENQRGRAPCWDRQEGLRFAWCDRWKDYLVHEKLERIGVGSRLLSCRITNFVAETEKQKAAVENCAAYAAKFRRTETRSNLVIFGGSFGVGKTHLAIGVVAELIANHRIRNAQFFYVPEFLERIRRSYDDPTERGLIDRAIRTDLLVLDDLAAQRTTDWVREQLNLISNGRWSNGRPTIITTNVTQDELEATLGPRATSRFFGDGFQVEVDGDDRRKVTDG